MFLFVKTRYNGHNGAVLTITASKIWCKTPDEETRRDHISLTSATAFSRNADKQFVLETGMIYAVCS